LGNVINLLQSRNLETVLAQEKELREELYKKQQENTQYKESIRSFLKNSHQKDIGIIYYKQRRFFFANQAAKEMVPININMLEGHPLTKSIKQVAQLVETYKTPQTVFTTDINSNRLIISGVPHLDHNSVILTISYPDISDIISKQINNLKDPSKWDYLLYLETTQPGQLISRLIPASGEKMLNFKINLLELALTTKALLLELPDEDVKAMVELIHTISMRQKLKTLKLHSPTYGFDTAIMLFGINSVFGKKNTEPPLLEQLDNSGTLFIQNIEFLDLETQEYLAEFIKYGVYRIFKSEQRVTSNARVICSTTNHLPTLVQEGKFSATLFNELKTASLVMPPLLSIDEQEFNELTEGLSEQTIKTDDFKSILELTSRDKRKLTDKRPNSLQQLRERIAQILITKSKETNLYHEIEITPAIEETDPELVQAARLGKHALRDKRLMKLLWHKFKNQNQIAHFLGVNRSSVNRRCKEYNLL
jgi:transcriptional regulator of aromatic amino acid metabolism